MAFVGSFVGGRVLSPGVVSSGSSRLCGMRVSPAFSSRRSVGLSAYTTTCLGNEVIGVDRVAERGPESSGEGSDISSKSFFSKLSFESLGISSELAHALRETGIEHPTSVQSNAIPAVCGGADVVIGAATGSGKTLAYLLPVLQMLKNEELFGNVERRSRRPRAVILVPTRELADQVLHVAKRLSHHFKFRAVGLVGGSTSLKKQKEALASPNPVDVIVSTTGRLLQHIDVRNVDLADVRYFVLDEVDTMFDGGFGKEVEKIIWHIKRRREASTKLQFISAGATHPSSALALYSHVFPTAKYINVDLHRPPPGLAQRFIDTTSSEKTIELVALLGEAERDGSLKGGRIIVFTNSTDGCRFLDHFLQEKNYTTSSIHGEMPVHLRTEAFKLFKERKTQILVGTDIAARGLDNLAIDHVILFDFPSSPVDYIHRAGRTARAGAKGRVTSFVTKKDRTLAEAIQEASRDKLDALERTRVRRLEADQRKMADERLNRSRIEKEEKIAKANGYRTNSSSRTGSSSKRPGGGGAGGRSSTDRRGKGKIFRTRAAPKRR